MALLRGIFDSRVVIKHCICMVLLTMDIITKEISRNRDVDFEKKRHEKETMRGTRYKMKTTSSWEINLYSMQLYTIKSTECVERMCSNKVVAGMM